MDSELVIGMPNKTLQQTPTCVGTAELRRYDNDMIVEITIIIASVAVSVVLIIIGVLYAMRAKWLRLSGTICGFVALHYIAYNLIGPHMRGYVYETNVPECRPYECPCKGIPYERALATYDEKKVSVDTPIMMRKFRKDAWNFYRWHDYVTHPRWELPLSPVPLPKTSSGRE